LSELGDYGVSREIEDAIRAIARSEVAAARPQQRYGLVKSVNVANRTAEIQYNGDTSTVWVPYGSERPAYLNQPVLIEGTAEDRRISQVLGNTQADVDLAALGATIAWETPSLVSGVAQVSASPARYRKVRIYGTDFIQLKGRVTVGSGSTTLWTFPTGFRPVILVGPVLIARDPSGGSNVAQIEISSGGVMTLTGKTTGADSGTTGSGGNSATTGNIINFDHNHKFLNLEWGTTDAYRNADAGNKNNANSNHTHTAPAHTHSVPSVTAPAWLCFDGVMFPI